MVNEGPRELPEDTAGSAASSDAAALEGMTVRWRQVTDALRDSERRYRELVEYSLGLICTHDVSGVILSINPAAAQSLGYQPPDGIGRNLRDFLSPDRRDQLDDYLRRIREQGRDEGLMSVQSRSGEHRVWLYRNVLSQSPDGTFHVLGHALDVTERVVAERTLRRSEQSLLKAQAELEERVKERTHALQAANDTLEFLAGFSEQLAPVVAFEQLLDVVHALALPFLADAALVHIAGDDGSIRLAHHAPIEPAQADAMVSSAHLARVVATGAVEILGQKDL